MHRINLYGGPGSGKSTLAHYLCWRLKSAGCEVELAREWIKREAFRQTNSLPSLEQLEVGSFEAVNELDLLQPRARGHQLEEELAALATGAVVVSESPLLLQAAYAEDTYGKQVSIRTAMRMEERSPGLHIFIERGDRPYRSKGRWQDAEAARVKDSDIFNLLRTSGLAFYAVAYENTDALWSIVHEKLGLSRVH